MKEQLICRHCHSILSQPITIADGNKQGIAAPELNLGQSLTPSGNAYRSYKPYRKSYGQKPDPLDFVPQIWMNREDITEVESTFDHSRLNGCCGFDGCGGPNIICAQCKTHIGTMMSDCWTPHFFIPDPNNTIWKECE